MTATVPEGCDGHTPTPVYAGKSQHPHPRCDQPDWFRCTTCSRGWAGRCGSSRHRVCKPCARSHRNRVRRVAHSGLTVPGRFVMMLTVTAPGERPHRMPSGDWCPCTPPGGVDLAQWNGEAVHRWGRLKEAIAYHLGLERIEYFRAAEPQDRGALHFHVPIGLPRPTVVDRKLVRELRQLAIHHGFGHEIDVQVVESERAASYVAKYASKSADARPDVPYVHRRTGEIGPGRWRPWTASRHWGLTMRHVREAQRLWWSNGGSSAEPGGTPAQPGAPLDIREHRSGNARLLAPTTAAPPPM